MTDDADTVFTPAAAGGTYRRGDVPERIKRRYFSEAQGSTLSFYGDATASKPMFRDHGDRLQATRNDPTVIRDLVAIASHRDWRAVTVQGETAFRREAWLAGELAGLEVRGYRPTDRDRQDLVRRREREERALVSAPAPNRAPTADPRGVEDRLKIIDTVVRNRIVEPAVQAQVMAAARARIADWLERGARFPPLPERRPVPTRERGR